MNPLRRRLAAVIFIAILPASGVAAARAKPVHHYVYFAQDRERMREVRGFLDTKGFEGAQVAYSWRQLEPSKDEYDFSLVREDLAFLTAHGKKLWIQVQDVTFSESRINVPKYLLQEKQYNGGASKQYRWSKDDDQAVVEGWMARRWDPAVQERFHRLLAQLGKEFDGKVAGINLAESSAGFGRTGRLFPVGYTHEIYRDAIIANMTALKRAFRKSIALQYANFMPGGSADLRAVYDAAKAIDVGVGGPDLLPFRRPQWANSYPMIRESAGVIPIGIAVQDGNYGDRDPKSGKRASVPSCSESPLTS